MSVIFVRCLGSQYLKLLFGLLYYAAGYIQGEMQFFAVAILESFPRLPLQLFLYQSGDGEQNHTAACLFVFLRGVSKTRVFSRSVCSRPPSSAHIRNYQGGGGEDDAVLISSKQDTNSLFSSPGVNTINRMKNVAWQWGIIMKQATWFAEFCFIFSSVLPLGCSSNFRVS